MKTRIALLAVFLLIFCAFFVGCTEYYEVENDTAEEFIGTLVNTETEEHTESDLPENTEEVESNTEADVSAETENEKETEPVTETEAVSETEAQTDAITVAVPAESEPAVTEQTETEPVESDAVIEESTAIESEKLTESEEKQTEAEPEKKNAAQTEYLLNTNSKKFHFMSCKSGQKTKESNRAYHTGTREEVIAKGYVPCKNCNP